MNRDEISIESLRLSNRATNALRRAGINTLEDLLQYNRDAISYLPAVGANTLKEILEAIDQYKDLKSSKNSSNEADYILPYSNYEEWIETDEGRSYILDFLDHHGYRIAELELLSAKAYNLLMINGYELLYQIAFKSADELNSVINSDLHIASEIERLVKRYVIELEPTIKNELKKKAKAQHISSNIQSIRLDSDYRDVLSAYVKANDRTLEELGLSNRARNQLSNNSIYKLSDFFFMSSQDLLSFPAMGTWTVKSILQAIDDYLTDNTKRIIALISGDEEALWDDEEVEERILALYRKDGFKGLSLQDITQGLDLAINIPQARLKRIIGKMISRKVLEYVDFRLYRIYPKFTDYLDMSEAIDSRGKDCIRRRFDGETLESIGESYGITRERIRQIVRKDCASIVNDYCAKYRTEWFDEDYYRYLYENYAIDKHDSEVWLGIPISVWKYLDVLEVKRGNKQLNEAVDDPYLDAGMRLKIKNYINRNKIFIDGIWIDKTRASLEEAAVRTLCKEEMSFEDFAIQYNKFLEAQEIPYDEKLYYTEAVYRTRKNHLSSAKYLLWKLNERIRYYDIEGRDFSELLEGLNLETYENIEISTVKLMRENPELVRRYDIQDQYELHNLLKKIVPEGAYHGFHCARMPIIRFGEFNREQAITELLFANAPISIDDFAELISEEYGFDKGTVIGSNLKHLTSFYHDGIYSVDYKLISPANKEDLLNSLTEDFYYLNEIKDIYIKLFPDGDVDVINPFNLKEMGFKVHSNYAFRNYNSIDAFFENLLTAEDILDISAIRKRFTYVSAFSIKLMEMKRALQIVEFEANQIISGRRLREFGIDIDQIRDYCDAVYDFVEEGQYFSSQLLRSNGFHTDLYELGFSDWFYANLLISDTRFSFNRMYNNIVLYKGNANTSIRSFLVDRIKRHEIIDMYDLITELEDGFGCKNVDRSDITYRIKDTEVFYDRILDKLYANSDYYYMELDRRN